MWIASPEVKHFVGAAMLGALVVTIIFLPYFSIFQEMVEKNISWTLTSSCWLYMLFGEL